MIRKLGLVLSTAAIAAAVVVACDKHDDDNKPPDLTTVVQEPGGKCVGYDQCPTPDDQHITAKLEPKEVTTVTEVPSVSLSPSSTNVEVPTVTATS